MYKSYDQLGEKVVSTRMETGLHCIFLPKRGFKRKFAILATPYGGIHRAARVNGRDVETPAGIAHFLEHKLFEDPRASIENRFAQLGASVNAFTTHTMTAYLFSTAENFSHCLELLLNFVQQPAFTEQGVLDERSIIAQEIKMYADQPNWAAYLGALEQMYGQHPVAEDIAGKLEDLERIDYQLLRDCHKLFYHPGRMVLVVAGDLNARELFELVARNQRAKDFGPLPRLEDRVPRARPASCRGERRRDMEVARPLFSLGLRDEVPTSFRQAVEREATASLLLEILVGKNSPFYNRLYDEGLIDNSFGVEYTSTPWFSHFIFGGESDDPQQLAEELVAELRRLRQCGISRQLLEVNRSKLLGLFLMELNGLESTVMAYATDWLQDVDYLARFDVLRNLSAEKVEELLAGLDLAQPGFSVVYPLHNS